MLGLGWAAKVGGTITPAKTLVTRTVSDSVNALTGDDVREEGASTPRLALEGFDAIRGLLIDVYMLPSENRTIVILDEYLQVCCPPSRTCAIYILDAVKGSIIYHASVPAPSGVCNVQATPTENWLVYYGDELPGTGQSKGYPDDKVKRFVNRILTHFIFESRG